MHHGLWFTGSNTARQVEGADPDHGYEATLAGNSGSGGTQGSTDSSLQAGSKAGPVGDDPLIARHLCLDALQHLSHQRSNVGLACRHEIGIFSEQAASTAMQRNVSTPFVLLLMHKSCLCNICNLNRLLLLMHQGARTFHVHLVSYRRPQPYCHMQQQTSALLSR